MSRSSGWRGRAVGRRGHGCLARPACMGARGSAAAKVLAATLTSILRQGRRCGFAAADPRAPARPDAETSACRPPARCSIVATRTPGGARDDLRSPRAPTPNALVASRSPPERQVRSSRARECGCPEGQVVAGCESADVPAGSTRRRARVNARRVGVRGRGAWRPEVVARPPGICPSRRRDITGRIAARMFRGRSSWRTFVRGSAAAVDGRARDGDAGARISCV